MNQLNKWGALFGAMLLSSSVFAGGIQVDGAWSRATAPGQDAAMVDMTITSDKEAKLIGFSSSSCKSAELHSMTHENGMMKMREVKSVALPAGKRVNLGEQGYHLMLIGLQAPLKEGDRLPLTLNIKSGSEATVNVEVVAEVKPLTKAAPKQSEQMHHMHHP